MLRSAVSELGRTIVMVTHDPIAAAYAVVFLSDGRIVDSLYRGRTTVGSGDAADRAGTEVVSESGEPLPDAAVSHRGFSCAKRMSSPRSSSSMGGRPGGSGGSISV
ncbi:MAG: putative transporter ATP-binding protein [Pseudonocardia sp.]|nr:putative transporter ATP-binding protein [Pseudonocardia sp.]